jgi:hypothetical protein
VSGVKLYLLYYAAGDSDELTPLPTTFLVYGSDMNSASNWLIIRSDRIHPAILRQHRAVSKAMSGTEDHHILFRVLTAL